MEEGVDLGDLIVGYAVGGEGGHEFPRGAVLGDDLVQGEAGAGDAGADDALTGVAMADVAAVFEEELVADGDGVGSGVAAVGLGVWGGRRGGGRLFDRGCLIGSLVRGGLGGGGDGADAVRGEGAAVLGGGVEIVVAAGGGDEGDKEDAEGEEGKPLESGAGDQGVRP